MKVALHQPQYLPWLGYFYKMMKCDIFVILDTVQYPKGKCKKYFHARNKVKTSTGAVMLTVPVKKCEGLQKYNEVEIAKGGWEEKHLKTLKFNYFRAPYFEEIYRIYEDALRNNFTYLASLNMYLIDRIADFLRIETRMEYLSNLLQTFGQKTNLIIDVCKAVKAGIYLSGTGGGKEYNDEVLLNTSGIMLEYSDFVHPEYPQLRGKFISNLSILDLLFNCGPNSKEILLNANDKTKS